MQLRRQIPQARPGALTAIAGVILMSGCGNSEPLTPGTRFDSVNPAASEAEKRVVRASERVTVDGVERNTSFVTIMRSGEQHGPSSDLNVFGQIVDSQMKPILAADGSTTIADSNDFSSLLPVGTKLFSVEQFESRPAAMYLTELSQDPDTGALSPVTTTALDLSGIHGLWNPCAGMVTPWNSHLGSEEYEPEANPAKRNEDNDAAVMAPYFGGDVSQTNPYYYGYPVEVLVTSEVGAHLISKHYSMGRFAHELSYVMPDQRTVYQSDDGTNVGFFMYVADSAANLSAGTLYAAKWQQTSPAGASSLVDADVSWVELGHASDTEIKALVEGGVTFDDIFATAEPADGVCPDGFTSVNQNGAGLECLQLSAGMAQAAAFLETRRYAGYLGATTELRKEEGITFDPASGRMYVSYSEVQYGMEDSRKNGTANDKYDVGTSNDVRALFNACGAVYGYDVGPDSDIGSDYVAHGVHGVIAGRMTAANGGDPDRINPTTIDAYAAGSPYENNTCDLGGLANPDNLSFMRGQSTLLIGEDTGSGHQNDMIWAYNVIDGKLTRIATTPYGAETTSLYYYPNVNEFGYIMAIVQHPYGESDGDKAEADSMERRSYFGYIGSLAPHH